MPDNNDKKLVTLQGLKKYHRDAVAAGAAQVVTYNEDMFDTGLAGVRLPDNTGHLHFEAEPLVAIENIVFEAGEPQDGRRLTVSFDKGGNHLGNAGNINEYLYQHNEGRTVHESDGSAPGAWYDLIYYHGKWWDMGYHDTAGGGGGQSYGPAGNDFGLVKSGMDVEIQNGLITVKDDSHNHVINNIDGLQAKLDGFAPKQHQHSASDISGLSDHLQNKAEKNHTHNISDVQNLQSELNGKAPSSHTHSAYANQNAFSNVAVSGQTTVSADSATDTLTLVAGSNVTITTDSSNDKVTIAAKDTTYNAATQSAAGLMSAADKTKLDGLTLGTLEITRANFAQYVSSYTLKLPATTTTVFLNYSAGDAGTTYIQKILKSDGTVFPNGTRLTFLLGSDYAWNDWGYFYSLNDQNPYHDTMTPGRITPYLYLHQRGGSTNGGYGYNPDTSGDMDLCDTNTHIDGTTAFSYIDFLFWNGCWWDGGYETNVLPYHTHSTYENPNIFQTVKAGTTTLSPDSKSDMLNIVGSGSVTVTANASTDTITISGTNTTYGAATQSAAGLMSAADKTKLDGIATGANKYSLPVATASALGGVKSGTDITVDSSGNVSVNNNSHTHTIENVSGLQSALDGKAASTHTHNTYVNQNAFSNVAVSGQTTVSADSATDTLTLAAGSNVTITTDATNDKVTIAAKDTTYGAATQSAAGLMSAADKTKLDGIATGANKYSLPVATASALGGVKSGTDITVDSSGNVSVNNNSHTHTIENITNLQATLNGKAASTHYHGLSHSNNYALIANTTTDTGYKMIDSNWATSFNMLKSVRTQASAPAWTIGNHSAGVAFGGMDTKGIITHAYNSPLIRFAGGNGSTFVWNMSIGGANGGSYSLSDFQNKFNKLKYPAEGSVNLLSCKAASIYLGSGNHSYSDYTDYTTIRIDSGNVHFPNNMTTVAGETIVRVMCWGTSTTSAEFSPYGKYTAMVTLQNSYGKKTAIFIPPRQSVTLQYVNGTTWTVLSKPDNGELYVNSDNWSFLSTSGRFKLSKGLPKILYLSPGNLSTTYNMRRIEVLDRDDATCYPELGETITIVPLAASQYLTWTNFGTGAGETQEFNFNAPVAIANLKAGNAGTFMLAAKRNTNDGTPYAFHWVDA